MADLRIKHKTTYRFREAVTLAPHRLLLRPRENRDLRLLSHVLTLDPVGSVKWAYDVFGNAVATATFANTTDTLTIESVANIILNADAWPIFDISVSAMAYHFRYSENEWTDLGALTIPRYLDSSDRLHTWTVGFVRGNPTDTLALLKDLNAGVAQRHSI